MLAETEDAFRTLTAGEYTKLQTQSDGQHERLLALRKRDGRSIAATEMSKGTRFQLYLAFRLAGYRQYSGSGSTLPFVADDIMETFDNTRTIAALGLLKEISIQGQALYFTHHEHLVDLAKDVCGDNVMIHQIPNQAMDHRCAGFSQTTLYIIANQNIWARFKSRMKSEKLAKIAIECPKPSHIPGGIMGGKITV